MRGIHNHSVSEDVRMEPKFCLLKISLAYIEPEISRTVCVPADITLGKLHIVIQIVMDWENYHLHEFEINKRIYSDDPKQLMGSIQEKVYKESNYRLSDLIDRKGKKFTYLYDYGDSWLHELKLIDKNFKLPQGQAEIFCLEGHRASPLEDIGGVGGYYNLCDALENPEETEYDYLLGTFGDEFDSEYVDLGAINSELQLYIKSPNYKKK